MTAVRYERPLESPAPLARPGHDTGGISSSATLTLQNPDGLVAALLWQAILVKDKSWVNTPLGPSGADFLNWFGTEGKAAESTVYSYEPTICRACRLIRKPPGRVATNDLRRVIGTFPQGSKHGATAHLRSWFKWMYEEGLIPENPAGRIRYPRKPKQAITDLYTAEEQAQILTAQADPMDRVGVLFLFGGGIRKAELAAGLVRHCNLIDKYFLVENGKGGKSRRVPIKGQLIRALEELFMTPVPGWDRPRLLDEHLLCPKAGGRSTKRMPGRPMGSRAMHEWWYQCLQRAGVVEEGVTRGRRMHAARHTYATDLGRATGWNFVAMQKNLGHSNFGTTVDLYTQFDFDDQAEAVAMLPEIGE